MTHNALFGKLTRSAFEHGAIVMGAGILMLLIACAVIGFLTYTKRWKWLWKEWISTLDPKKIGVMYLIVVILMIFKGLIDAGMIRAQQALAVGAAQGYLSADHFQQIFTAHGTTMIFFVGMGIVFSVSNLLIPLQIGARDVAFPFLNSLSFWLFAAGFLLLNASLAIGDFSACGWVGYPPLSELEFSPGVGVDYWIWSVQITGIGSLFGGLNFFATIFKMRCPGMTFMKMPVFVWAMLATMVLILFAFPILTATLLMLSLDRLMDMHFFTASGGGNPMMYVNLIWAWGHPEVYILILPAFGIFSEVVATFSQKRLFGYVSMVWAIIFITFLSFIVWLHHFFTMGASANVNAFFGAMTMLIAIPTGVKIFNWLFTMHHGRIHFTTPMLWFLGFVFIFTIGGMAGVLLSIAPFDFQVHNSLFLVAHFHSVIIGGVVFGFFAGFTYWFPKFTGFVLDEKLGKWAFWLWITGFLLAFMPLYILGLMGATRRLSHYDAGTGWQPYFIVASVGVILITIGVGFQVLQVFHSWRWREKYRTDTGDPWNGRTLEWSTASPPPLYNFAHVPEVHERDAFWASKHRRSPIPPYEDIVIPKDTPIGMIIAAWSFVLGFAIIWQIFWLVAVSMLGLILSAIYRLSEKETEYVFPAKQVFRIEHGDRYAP
ncbi:MAG: cytochrome o ubiquinol oxidase subunit I [Chlamydiae bacterium RIFCSPHIGHO2_12_FULL_49_11]|nr:MAG: cytochrome o ubiquinol oxidase subunit I [Chlamydiae bacterium RIFCSPHIGHO2_12_FULL_49_11]